MKKLLVFMCALALVSGFTFFKVETTEATVSNKLAVECDTQDPYSPCFAPGEKADDCDTQDPYSPCFAPGEKADDTAVPQSTSTPSYATPKPTATITPYPQESYPSADDILKTTNDKDSGGIGLLEGLLLSPIVWIIGLVVGFFIFIGIIILVIILVTRRSNKKDVQTDQPINKENK